MNTIQQILSNLQADVAALAQYVASLGGGSTAVQQALANVNSALTQLQSDANASPIVQATVQADVVAVMSLVSTLSAAIAGTVAPVAAAVSNPAVAVAAAAHSAARINPLTGRF